jgi:glyoxylase-like metal-dependent hydrolase (beta-lactamase superfamily II)
LDLVSKELKRLKINPEKIIAIFLTHTDMDHVAAIKLFKKATLYLGAQEVQLIDGRKSRFLFTGNRIDTKKYSAIVDQQILTIENIVIRGILTPGHTPGSMCFLINDKYLFTGDLLSIKKGEVDKFNDFFNMDTQTAINSIEKITGFPKCEYIFSSHYGYTDNYKYAVIDWIK